MFSNFDKISCIQTKEITVCNGLGYVEPSSQFACATPKNF